MPENQVPLVFSFATGMMFSGILCLILLWKNKFSNKYARPLSMMIAMGVGFAIGSYLASGWERGIVSGLGFYIPVLVCLRLRKQTVLQHSN